MAPVQSLEEELGVLLFTRRGRNVVLTDAGRAFLRYVETGLDTLDGEQELPVRKLLHRVQDGRCLAELPGFNIAQLRLSYRELEQLAAQKGWTLQKL